MRWLTADTHFFHKNIITYCRRPFKDIWEMNAYILEKWNAVVDDYDEVWHLGDFAFFDKYEYEATALFKQLKGRKYLIRGNHDKGRVLNLPWTNIYNEPKYMHNEPTYRHQITLIHDSTRLVLSTDPDTAIFCANVHDIWKMRENKLNVGVDVWHFRPVAWDDALAYWKHRWEYWQAHRRDA